jgi:serine/threonine protein kinase
MSNDNAHNSSDEPRKQAAPTVKLPEAPPTVGLGEEGTPPAIVLNLQPGSLFEGRFEIIRQLPGGAQALVYVCKDRDKQREAVLKLYTAPGTRPKEEIIKQLLNLEHKDVLSLLHYSELANLFYEVWEYAEGGSLDTYIPLSENELRNNVQPQVLNGLKYLHAKKIVHRDIKPSNLFYRKPDRQDVVIGDFGMSSMLATGSIQRSSIGGTLAFMAPEAIAGHFAVETDYYALGMTLLVLSQKSANLSDVHVYDRVPMPENVSEEFRTLLRGLLTKERSERWGASHIERWLRGEKVTVYRASSEESGLKPWKLADGAIVHTLSDLATVLEERSDLATEMVGHGDISKHTFVLERDYLKHAQIRKVEESTSPLHLKVLEIVYILDDTRPYRLTQRAKVTSCEELAQLIDKDSQHWNIGKEHLFNGRIPLWLRYYRDGEAEAIANAWQSVASDYKRKQDQGLEYLLHLLNPNLPKPTIEVSPTHLALGRVEVGKTVTGTIQIANSGRGHLGGRVRLSPAEIPGVSIHPEIFDGNNNEITVTFDPSDFPVGRRATADILIESNAEETTLRVPMSVRVGYPILSNIALLFRGRPRGLRGLYDLLLRHGIVSFFTAAGGLYILLPYIRPYFTDPFGEGGITTKLVWTPSGELAPYLSGAWQFFVWAIGMICLGLERLNRGYLLPAIVGLLAFLRVRRKMRKGKTTVEKARGRSLFLFLVVLSFLLYPQSIQLMKREYQKFFPREEGSAYRFLGNRGLITADRVSLRREPSRRAAVLRTLRINTVVDVLEPAVAGFSKVRLLDGTEGYVYSRFVKLE